MKIKVLLLAFAQLLMFSLTSHSEEKCHDGDFWHKWFKESQFIGFGNIPSQNQIANAQLDRANQFFSGKSLTKDYSKAIKLYKQLENDRISEVSEEEKSENLNKFALMSKEP